MALDTNRGLAATKSNKKMSDSVGREGDIQVVVTHGLHAIAICDWLGQGHYNHYLSTILSGWAQVDQSKSTNAIGTSYNADCRQALQRNPKYFEVITIGAETLISTEQAQCSACKGFT